MENWPYLGKGER